MNRGFYCLLGMVFYAPFSSAQDAASAEVSETFDRLPYEVVVTPLVKRSDLRRLIVQVEDDLFARFNELNLDDAYDVICYEYVPTMSHISKRQCEPLFMVQARGANASAAAFGLASKYVDQQLSAYLNAPVAMRSSKNTEYRILQEKMEELNRTDIKFRSIGMALEDLKGRLENFAKD
ncbi:MAG: hypothetical protein DHS20C12_07830 [Pseudohongiella sp.]|nr:MAG: hypothetical protein DHS20C12_07830 [Pseudohongiella sp.]